MYTIAVNNFVVFFVILKKHQHRLSQKQCFVSSKDRCVSQPFIYKIIAKKKIIKRAGELSVFYACLIYSILTSNNRIGTPL